jgi:cytidylate kinase
MLKRKQLLVITIDGPAGSGKTSVARLIAKRLGIRYIDTGAMYRALTYKAIKKRIDLDNPLALGQLARSSRISLKGERTFLDGVDVTKKIRTENIAKIASKVAGFIQVRKALVKLQRSYAKKGPLVAEGRDQGTVVFPDADLKIYLDADIKERAKRRLKDLKSGTLAEIIKQIEARDKQDTKREASPLKIPESAIYIDTTKLTLNQVVQKILKIVSLKWYSIKTTKKSRGYFRS